MNDKVQAKVLEGRMLLEEYPWFAKLLGYSFGFFLLKGIFWLVLIVSMYFMSF